MKFIICDIDGTIAKLSQARLECLEKKPIDWDTFNSLCFDDEPYEHVVDMIKNLSDSGEYELIFCTGRSEEARYDTQEWLDKHELRGHLIMRPKKNHGKDTSVKPQELLKYLRTRHLDFSDISFILEDRNNVVAKWRDLGIPCFQVQEGDF